MIGRFSNTHLQPSKIQTHADQLDGTAGRGNFKLGTAQQVSSVLMHSSAPLDWSVSFLIPNPEEPDNEAAWVEYLWLVASAQGNVIDAVGIVLPAGSRVVVRTSVSIGANPKVQIITRTLITRQE